MSEFGSTCPNTEFLWSAFSCILAEYRKIRTRNNTLYINKACTSILEKVGNSIKKQLIHRQGLTGTNGKPHAQSTINWV